MPAISPVTYALPALLAAASWLPAQGWFRHGGPAGDATSGQVVTDFERQRLTQVDLLGDTWEWDGSEWRKFAAPAVTSSLAGTLVYDAARNQTLLAAANAPALRRWDGSSWTPIQVAQAPAEIGPAAFDPGRNRVVMLLPQQRATAEWDGVAWSTPSAPGQTAVGYQPQLVRDSGRNQVLLLQRSGAAMPLQTLRWNGTSWQLLATGGPGSDRFACADDPVRGRIVAHGGVLGPAETWEWNGTAWSRIQTNGPLRRREHVLAFDPVRGQVLSFGGIAALQSMRRDAWAWNGATWTQIALRSEPDSRLSAAMTYDAARDRLVLHSGAVDNVATDELWEWDGIHWAQIAYNGGPGSRIGHAMAFDTANARCLLFGGLATGGLSNELWSWNGNAWALLHSGGPGARSNHGMAWDSVRNRLVLHGGFGGTTPQYTDTWEWDGLGWTQLATNGPPARAQNLITFARNGIVPAASRTIYVAADGTTYAWSGAAWTQIAAGFGRTVVSAGYDSLAQNITAIAQPQLNNGYLEHWTLLGNTWSPASLPPQPFLARIDTTPPCLIDDLRNARQLLYTGTYLFEFSSYPAASAVNAPGCSGGATPPTLTSFGPPRLGDGGYRLELRAAPGQPALIGIASLVRPLPLSPGCTWSIGGCPTVMGLTDPSGTLSVLAPIPAMGLFLGRAVLSQGAALDPSPQGFALSPVLMLLFGH